MSYRSIKRVLGESSLERKIRILFTISLLILIAVSFLWVNRITEQLIVDNTTGKAQELASTFLLKKHLTAKKGDVDTAVNEVFAGDLFRAVAEEYGETTNYSADTLTTDEENSRFQTKPVLVTDAKELEIFAELESQVTGLQYEQDRLYAGNQQKNSKETLAAAKRTPSLPDKTKSRFDNNEFVFYQPIVFKTDCLLCHYHVARDPSRNDEFDRRSELAKDDPSAIEEVRFEQIQSAPTYVLRIKLPYEEAKSAITKSRAILVTVAIITAFLSMLALYLIVRYVIVKPLEHLRDVTEEIGLGRTDVRAELKTGDEFEELSRSFNRMLRHLLDTQNALEEAKDDLHAKVGEQAQLNLKLHEMNQIKGEFLANMGHELRTPLNSIIGFSEILEAGEGMNEKQVRFASNIRKSGRLLLDLFNDILDLAKLEAGKMEIKPSEFKIHALTSQLSDMVRHLADSKNIHMILAVDENLPPMYQDQIKVRQVLTNLLSNAIKFTPEGGRINISAIRNDEEQLILAVQDTGVGIGESDREIVFEKFRQGPSAIGSDALTREVSGTGLGLSIVREICILLGGKIELESEVGAGSTFTVTLPWRVKLMPKINSELSQTLNEITKQQRVDFARANETPTPTTDDLAAKQNSPAAPESDPPVSSQQINPQ